MPNMTPYEPTAEDLKFFIERAQRQISAGQWDDAIKTIEQAKLLEDTIIIYRLSRAPERKVFRVQVD